MTLTPRDPSSRPLDADPSLQPTVARTTDASGPTAPPAGHGTPVPRSIGGYRIFDRLGEGGMGIVYEAEQETPRRRVALKVIRGGTFVDEMRVRMFQREAETLARLRHPNIGAIYEAGRTEAGEHFFAMELVRGQDLSDYLLETARWTVTRFDSGSV
jgi:serine/threonine protein kinase